MVNHTESHEIQGLFENPPTPPPEGSTHFFLEAIKVPEHSGILPLNVSTFEGYGYGREEFLRGAALLGLGTEAEPKRKNLLPQQYVIADAIQAQNEHGVPHHSVTSVCVPRRAAKTTSFWAVALGRISNPDREAYQVAFTAQTQVKARARFLKDVVAPLERLYPEPSEAPFIINRGAATASLTWKATGGVISIVGPNAEAFRGDAYSLIGVDEAQEVEPGEKSEDLLQGILPTLATTTVLVDGELMAAGQLVLIGTAGEHKSGIFHDRLTLGREGLDGIVEFAADPSTPDFDPDDEDQPLEGTTSDPEVWKAAHPAIGTLVPLSAVAESFRSMTLQAFKREWLGIWPDSSSITFIDLLKWQTGRILNTTPTPPSTFALGFSCDHNALRASIVAVWRDENELAHVFVLDQRDGTKWAAKELLSIAKKYRTPIIYDDKSSAAVNVIEELNRATARPQTAPQSFYSVSNAAALFHREVGRGAVRHYDQAPLNEAVRVAVKKQQPQSPRWTFRRSASNPDADISALEAASLALQVFDQTPARQPLPRMTL